MSDEILRELRREALLDVTVFPRYLIELHRCGKLIPEDGVRLVFRLRIDTKRKRLRSHPWAERDYKPGSGKWWAIGVGPDEWKSEGEERKGVGRVFVQPAADNGFRWWNRDHSFAFDAVEEVVPFLGDLVVEWREVALPVAVPPRKRKKRRRRVKGKAGAAWDM